MLLHRESSARPAGGEARAAVLRATPRWKGQSLVPLTCQHVLLFCSHRFSTCQRKVMSRDPCALRPRAAHQLPSRLRAGVLSAAVRSALGGEELALSKSAQVPLRYLRLLHANAELFLKCLYSHMYVSLTISLLRLLDRTKFMMILKIAHYNALTRDRACPCDGHGQESYPGSTMAPAAPLRTRQACKEQGRTVH